MLFKDMRTAKRNERCQVFPEHYFVVLCKGHILICCDIHSVRLSYCNFFNIVIQQIACVIVVVGKNHAVSSGFRDIYTDRFSVIGYLCNGKIVNYPVFVENYMVKIVAASAGKKSVEGF